MPSLSMTQSAKRSFLAGSGKLAVISLLISVIIDRLLSPTNVITTEIPRLHHGLTEVLDQ